MSVQLTSKPANPFRGQYSNFIAGQWAEGSTRETIAQFNPPTGKMLALIAAGSPADVGRAVAAASAAFPACSRTTAQQRQKWLLEIAARLKRRHRDFALMESLNNGKTLAEASYLDVPHAWGEFEYYAGAANSLHGETRHSASPGREFSFIAR